MKNIKFKITAIKVCVNVHISKRDNFDLKVRTLRIFKKFQTLFLSLFFEYEVKSPIKS